MFAADAAFDSAAFRASIPALSFVPDIPLNPRRSGCVRPRGPRHVRLVPGRWVVERTHAHLGTFRGVRTRWCRLVDSYEAFLAAAAAHLIIRQVRL